MGHHTSRRAFRPPFHTRSNLSMGHQEFFRLFPAKYELERAGFDVDLGLDLHIEMGVWPTRVICKPNGFLSTDCQAPHAARGGAASMGLPGS